MVLSIVWTLLVFILLYSLVLIIFQRNMIYFPRAYDVRYDDLLPTRVALTYQTDAGRQVAYYIPAKNNQKPNSIWVMFGGNAALALDWTDLVMQYPDQHTAFLLVDYPGFGQNHGKPSKQANIAAGSAAYQAMLKHLRLSEHATSYPFKLNVLGHSLGASVAVAFALNHPVQHLVLLSPFTNMQAMVRKHVALGLGWLLQGLVFDQYNAKSDLTKLQSSQIRPQVNIIHGKHDEIVPVTMSHELANKFQEWVVYRELPEADHNFVYAQLPVVIETMLGPGSHIQHSE